MKAMKALATFLVLGFLTSLACSHKVSYKEQVENALEQAELEQVTVSEDQDENTITLGGTLHSAEAKNKAGAIATAVAGTRIIVNEIGVEPVGSESQAADIASKVDDDIEKNYKAALIPTDLNYQHIKFKATNGVLTLTGTVHNPAQRQYAENLAAKIPNVQQVLNQIDVKR